MNAKIHVPDSTDMHNIATLLACSSELAAELIGQSFDTSLDDLPRIQQLLDTGLFYREDQTALHALGMTFGQVLAAHNPDYDWWMVEDDEGRDPCLRFQESDLLVYPQTLLSRRVSEDEAIDVLSLYDQLLDQLAIVAAKQVAAKK